jgi:hypothetical protein
MSQKWLAGSSEMASYELRWLGGRGKDLRNVWLLNRNLEWLAVRCKKLRYGWEKAKTAILVF